MYIEWGLIIVFALWVAYLLWRISKLKKFYNELEIELNKFDKQNTLFASSLCSLIKKATLKATKAGPKNSRNNFAKEQADSIVRTFKQFSSSTDDRDYLRAIDNFFGTELYYSPLSDEEVVQELAKVLS